MFEVLLGEEGLKKKKEEKKKKKREENGSNYTSCHSFSLIRIVNGEVNMQCTCIMFSENDNAG